MASSTQKVTLKKGEGRWVTFTVERPAGTPLDVSSATLKLAVKEKITDTAYLVEIEDAAMNKDDAAQGIVLVNITATHTNALGVGSYVMELRTILIADEDVDKSDVMYLVVEKSVFND